MDKTKIFIEKARLKHGDEYDYSKVNYINAKTKIEIICNIHRSFWQTPDAHLQKKDVKNVVQINVFQRLQQ